MKQLRAESFTLPLIKWVALGLSLYPPSFPWNRGNEADSSLRYSSVDVLSDRLTFPFWNRNVPPKRKALSRKPEHAQPEAADFKWFFQKKNKLRMKHWSYLYGDALGDYIYTQQCCIMIRQFMFEMSWQGYTMWQLHSEYYFSPVSEQRGFWAFHETQDAMTLYEERLRPGPQKAAVAKLLNNAPYWCTASSL